MLQQLSDLLRDHDQLDHAFRLTYTHGNKAWNTILHVRFKEFFRNPLQKVEDESLESI